MSLFDETDDPQEIQESKFDDIVGEGKRYSDNDAVAKAISEKDRFIVQLQKENSEAREKLQSAATMEAIMARIADVSKTPDVPTTQPDTNQPVVPDNDSNVKTMMEQMFAQYEAKQVVNKNSEFVEKRLNDAFGADAQQIIRSKAQELSLSLAEMRKLAVEKPQVFLALIGVSEMNSPVTAAPVSRGGQSVQPPTGVEVRNKKFYDKLKAQNFMEYISPKIQNQMMKDALKLGDAFY